MVQPMASEAGRWGMTPACVTHFTWGGLRACGLARFVQAHWRLIGGNVLQGGGLHYSAPLGPAWSDMVCVDCPSRGPHDSQRVCSDDSGATMTRKARSVARAEARRSAGRCSGICGLGMSGTHGVHRCNTPGIPDLAVISPGSTLGS
jgi:hypothetical protein